MLRARTHSKQHTRSHSQSRREQMTPGLSREHVPRPCSRGRPVNMAETPQNLSTPSGTRLSYRHYGMCTSSARDVFGVRKVRGQVADSRTVADKRPCCSGSVRIGPRRFRPLASDIHGRNDTDLSLFWTKHARIVLCVSLRHGELPQRVRWHT